MNHRTKKKNSYSIKDRLVFGQCNHAQPVAQVFQQGAIREIGSCLVRGQQNLKEMERWESHYFTNFDSSSAVLQKMHF